MRDRIINIFAFVVLTLLWLGFGIALLINQDFLDITWHSFRSWPLMIQLIIGLLVLPVTVGLWIWETSWPLLLRLLLVFGLAWMTLYIFLPRKIQKTGSSENQSSTP